MMRTLRHWRAGWLAWVAASLLLPAAALGSAAIHDVQIFDDGRAHGLAVRNSGEGDVQLAWTFCPSDRLPCREDGLAWIEMKVRFDAYSARRNDPHESIRSIVDQTRSDFAPIVTALKQHFASNDVHSDVARVAFVQGLVQAVQYEYDDSTGWTDYPKFGMELLVDEQGDCDDAAIAAAVLLHDLGYEVWFVLWDRSEGNGHLSTAVRPERGDLREAAPPAGSRWVLAGDGTKLLHVDATGSKVGCGQAGVGCAALGWNKWHLQNLVPVSLARPDDPDLEQQIPVSAWANGGRDRPDRKTVDRRSSDSDEIERDLAVRADLDARNRARLQSFGIPEEHVAAYLQSRATADAMYVPTVVFCSAGLVLFVWISWRRRRDRRQRVALERSKRQAREF